MIGTCLDSMPFQVCAGGRPFASHWPLASMMGLCLAVVATTVNASELEVPAAVRQAEQERIEAIARASDVTLSIFGKDKSAGGGSGVLISPDGYALTNFHVVQPCGNHLKCGLNTGQLYDAVVVGIDPTGDLALIKLTGRDDFPAAVMGDSNQVRVGDPCFAVGNPFLLATDLRPTVTFGVVSGVRRYQPPAAMGILEYTDCIQTDAAINPGNSGGPLFNAEGHLIGINGRGSFEKRNRVNVGVGYAISIQQVVNFLGVLHSGRVVDHATLGATVASDAEGRVVISNILESSDAYRRGLRYGDEIVSIWERRINSPNTFKNVLGILPRGWRVPVAYRRDGQQSTVHVRLAGVHSPEVLLRLVRAGGGPPSPKVPDGKQEEQLPDEKDQPNSDQPPAEDEEKNREGSEQGSAPDDQDEPSLPERMKRLRDRFQRKEQLPPHIDAIYSARHGYANYYFNQLNRQRVWDAFEQSTRGTGQSGKWTLRGRVENRGPLRVELSDGQLNAQSNLLGDIHQRVTDLSQNVTQAKGPDGSGGLYLALHLWRRLLTEGPENYGEVIYWGTAPLPNRDDLYDVLLGTFDIVESRFYFDRDSGRLAAMEMFPDVEVDPCEMYFNDYREVNGRWLPFQIDVVHGNTDFGQYFLDEVSFENAEQEGA